MRTRKYNKRRRSRNKRRRSRKKRRRSHNRRRRRSHKGCGRGKKVTFATAAPREFYGNASKTAAAVPLAGDRRGIVQAYLPAHHQVEESLRAGQARAAETGLATVREKMKSSEYAAKLKKAQEGDKPSQKSCKRLLRRGRRAKAKKKMAADNAYYTAARAAIPANKRETCIIS